MAMAWDGRDKMFYSDSEDNRDSLQRHNEHMRKFRLAHPRCETIDSKDIRTADWFSFVPIRRVKPERFWQN